MKKVIAIDFDGTIVTEAYPEIGEEIAGAIEGIKRLQGQGLCCILWTCRTDEHLDAAVSWLADRGIVMDYVNESNAEAVEYWGTNPRKIAAEIYIDDRSVGGFVGWETALKEIERYLSSAQPEE